MPLPIVKFIVYQVLIALNYMHTKLQLIHADLKPENILLETPIVFSSDKRNHIEGGAFFADQGEVLDDEVDQDLINTNNSEDLPNTSNNEKIGLELFEIKVKPAVELVYTQLYRYRYYKIPRELYYLPVVLLSSVTSTILPKSNVNSIVSISEPQKVSSHFSSVKNIPSTNSTSKVGADHFIMEKKNLYNQPEINSTYTTSVSSSISSVSGIINGISKMVLSPVSPFVNCSPKSKNLTLNSFSYNDPFIIGKSLIKKAEFLCIPFNLYSSPLLCSSSPLSCSSSSPSFSSPSVISKPPTQHSIKSSSCRLRKRSSLAELISYFPGNIE
jgi:hypothetical protein